MSAVLAVLAIACVLAASEIADRRTRAHSTRSAALDAAASRRRLRREIERQS